jgi:hypothetical protein
VISMKRKQPSKKVERLTRRHIEARAQAGALASKLARMAADFVNTLRQANPASPETLNDRAADNWETLLAIADLAGGHWSNYARAAAKALSGEDSDDSLSIRLLADIRDLLRQHREDQIGSTELCEKLCGMELAPWSTLAHGKPLTAAKLARMLKSFDVHPQRTAARSEYLKADFADAISLYAPYPPDESAKATQTNGRVGRNAISEVPSDGTLKNAESPTERTSSGTMEVSDKGIARGREFSAIEDAGFGPLHGHLGREEF